MSTSVANSSTSLIIYIPSLLAAGYLFHFINSLTNSKKLREMFHLTTTLLYNQKIYRDHLRAIKVSMNGYTNLKPSKPITTVKKP